MRVMCARRRGCAIGHSLFAAFTSFGDFNETDPRKQDLYNTVNNTIVNNVRPWWRPLSRAGLPVLVHVPHSLCRLVIHKPCLALPSPAPMLTFASPSPHRAEHWVGRGGVPWCRGHQRWVHGQHDAHPQRRQQSHILVSPCRSGVRLSKSSSRQLSW